MNSKSLTVRELLTGGVQEFDPLQIDTSEIQALSNSIPSSGEIDLNVAEILATKFLKGADLTSELLAIATCHVSKLETAKKRAYSEAALAKASAAGIKTDRSRLLFADADPDYIEACNKYSEALAFVKWVGSKQESFIRTHYMMKKIIERGYSHEQAAGFNPSIEKVIGETEWKTEESHEEQKQEDDFGSEW